MCHLILTLYNRLSAMVVVPEMVHPCITTNKELHDQEIDVESAYTVGPKLGQSLSM